MHAHMHTHKHTNKHSTQLKYDVKPKINLCHCNTNANLSRSTGEASPPTLPPSPFPHTPAPAAPPENGTDLYLGFEKCLVRGIQI